MWTASFWKAAAERAIRTLAQTMIAILAVGHTTVLTVDWQQALAVAATATVLSLLTSIVASEVGNTGPSLANEALVPPVTDHAPINLTGIDPTEVG